ncbi:MAG: phosphotransferase [Pseudomonadales bacterium]|nr:phosphotransferase [Pseudomonadales bacterium]
MSIISSEMLVKAHRDIQLPFDLRIKRGDGQIVEVHFIKLLRLLPGKRVVALARCNNQHILVKTFIGRSANRYAAKERAGVKFIISAGIRTPALLWQGELMDGFGQILAFEYLEQSVCLQDRWDSAVEDDERVDVLARAMITIAKLHNQGIVQSDIHLGNFLMSQGRIYTIDGGGVVRKTDSSLAEPESLENLSWFFAQYFSKYDEFVQVVFPAYEAVRGWAADPDRVIDLHGKINSSRQIRKKAYLNKAFRDCTRFTCETSFSQFMVCERSEFNEEMANLLADPDKFISAGEILKDGNSATVALVELANRSLVIKRYNIKNKLHAVTRAFQKSRAWKSWFNAFNLEFLGIPSLKPVAMLEHRLGPLRNKAYFITEYIKGPDALALFRGLKKPDGELEALAQLLRNLSASRISHGDLKATNFLMAEDGPVIIDLDAMREIQDKDSFDKAFNSDLTRFMKNWEDQPELESQFKGLLSKLSS